MADNVQQYLTDAQRHYAQAERTIQSMVDHAKKQGRNVSFSLAMSQFDSILETILLSVAAENGSFSEHEEQFIRGLTRYGDALTTVNAVAQEVTPGWHITWGEIKRQRASFSVELAKYAATAMDRVAQEFAETFASFDSDAARNYLRQLLNSVLAIMTAMDRLDDGAKASIQESSVAVANSLLSAKWGKYLGTAPSLSFKSRKSQDTKPQQQTTRPGGSASGSQVNGSDTYLMNYGRNRDIYANSVIYIEVEHAGGSGSGSGVIITRDGYALTCNHVVSGAGQIRVKVTNAGAKPVFVPARVCATDKTNDLALLKLQDGSYYHAEVDMDRAEPVLGENVAIYGFPFGRVMSDSTLELNVSYCRGYVASTQTIHGYRRTLLDITARSGNSGSPVTSIDNGKVIGIYFGGFNPDNRKDTDDIIRAMIPMQYIHRLLKACDKK